MKLKQGLLVMAAALGITHFAGAQIKESDLKKLSTDYYEWGVKAGANFQQLSGYAFTTDYHPGGFGGFYAKRRKNLIGIQLEVNVSTSGYVTTYPVAHNFTLAHTRCADTVSKGEFNTMYIHVPLLLELRPGRHFAFQFGGQYSYLLSNKDNNGVFTKRYGTEDILNKNNVSVLLGFELDICKNFRLGARYAVGMSDLDKDKFVPLTDSWHINSAQAFLTYRIGKWGIKI